MNMITIWQTTTTKNTDDTATQEDSQPSCRHDHEVTKEVKERFRIWCAKYMDTIRRTDEIFTVVQRDKTVSMEYAKYRKIIYIYQRVQGIGGTAIARPYCTTAHRAGTTYISDRNSMKQVLSCCHPPWWTRATTQWMNRRQSREPLALRGYLLWILYWSPYWV